MLKQKDLNKKIVIDPTRPLSDQANNAYKNWYYTVIQRIY